MRAPFSRSLGALAVLICALAPTVAWAEGSHDEHAGHDHGAHGEEHGSAASEVDSHGDAHGHDAHGHVPHFSDINWFYGLIGEKEGVEPSLLWRPPGTPIPLGALILNTAILFFLIGRFGGPGIKQGLVDRKQRIAGDIERASKMKEEAEEQLAHYEEKLHKVESEMTRIKEDMRRQAEADRVRILEEAKVQRAALEAESRKLVEQELAQARQDATIEAIRSAFTVAREQIVAELKAQDQERLANEFLGEVESRMKKTTGAVS
jgi:F-type H+-transporting ATPase subunit b